MNYLIRLRARVAIDSQDITEIIPHILEFKTRLEEEGKPVLNLVA